MRSRESRERARMVVVTPLAATTVLVVSLVSGTALANSEGRDAAVLAQRQLEEVIVTATRREESNQRVPIGIAAFSADDAQKLGATDGQSLATLVPGLLFNRQANTSIPFLRGVGTPVGQSGDEPSVALYIDDVYVPAASASMASFKSFDRIEVAKGPQ